MIVNSNSKYVIKSRNCSKYVISSIYEEIQLAVKAAAVASKKEIRSRFQSSSDLIHRLFVCISGRTLDTI